MADLSQSNLMPIFSTRSMTADELADLRKALAAAPYGQLSIARDPPCLVEEAAPLRQALIEIAAPLPSTRGMDAEATANWLRAELERRIALAKNALHPNPQPETSACEP